MGGNINYKVGKTGNMSTKQVSLDRAKPITLRVTDSEIERKLEDLAKQQNLSLNMTVNMLLGYAFNEVDRTKKTFKSKIIFESE